MPEPVAEVDGALIRLVHGPAAKLPQDVAERVLAAPLAGEERREVLREAFAQPLLVVVLPAHGLPQPLMRELVREEELGEVVEVAGIVAPA